MSLSQLLRVILVLSAVAAPGAALAQCSRDTDCKGDRVCDNGACVAPAERASPPPLPRSEPPPPAQPPPAARPPPPRPAPARTEAAWEASARKNVFSYNALSTVGGWLTAGGGNLQAQYPGLTIQQFMFIYERALTSNIAIFGTIAPNYWSSPAAGSTLYMSCTLGWKYYFFGNAPDGFYAGGEVGNLPLDLGPGLIAEAGYQWLLDFGLQFSVVGGLVISGFGLGPGFGATIGWNF